MKDWTTRHKQELIFGMAVMGALEGAVLVIALQLGQECCGAQEEGVGQN
jgi:hypothetical protein